MDLETRLTGLGDNEALELARMTNQPKYNPKSGYLKDDNVNIINNYLHNLNVSKSSASQINKSPLKIVVYGIRLFGNKGITQNIVSRLTGNEAMYFLAGLYSERKDSDEKELYSANALVPLFIQGGIKGMAIVHNVHKTKPITYGPRKVYTTEPTLPNAGEIGKYIKLPEEVVLFNQAVLDEKAGEDDRLSIMMEGKTAEEKQELVKYFNNTILKQKYNVYLF